MVDHVFLILKVEYLAIPYIYYIVNYQSTITLEIITPIINSNENAPIFNAAAANTQASNTEDLDNSLYSQSTQVSEYD